MKRFFTFIPFILISIITIIIIANRFGLTNTPGIVDNKSNCYVKNGCINDEWRKTEEWNTVKHALIKDKEVIYTVSKKTKVSPIMIASITSVEQLRLFFDEREIFKQIFKPIGKLGVQTNFSWGVTGIKENTARQIENNLKNNNSDFYLSKDFENLLDFDQVDIDSERFSRITNNNCNYYSYLYTALFIKQIENQWKLHDYDISNRPEIIGTLYSLGFEKSKPNSEPKAGGSIININGIDYSFGGLTYQIFNSQDIKEMFDK